MFVKSGLACLAPSTAASQPIIIRLSELCAHSLNMCFALSHFLWRSGQDVFHYP